MRTFATDSLREKQDILERATPAIPMPKPVFITNRGFPTTIVTNYQLALRLAKAGAWDQLKKNKRYPRNEELEKVIKWLSIRHAKSLYGFEETAKFIKAHPIWPERNRLITKAETLMDGKITAHEKDVWFSEYFPKTTTGHLKWISALESLDDKDRRNSAVQSLWQNKLLTRKQQRMLSRRYKNIITPGLSWERLDHFLWRGYIRSSQKMYPYVTKDERRLAEARLRLRHMMGAVDPAIEKVPPILRNDPGLVYERLRWRHRKGMKKKARELLWNVGKNQKYPRLWWRERARQIRYALDENEFGEAYQLAKSHIQKTGIYYAEAQWLAGWIAVQYLDKPEEAARYFIEMYNNVRTPLSKSRASYWAGRAFAKQKLNLESKKWYQLASAYPTTFYGQLASERLGMKTLRFPGPLQPNNNEPHHPKIIELTKIAKWLHKVEEGELASDFIKTAARAVISPQDAKLVTSSAKDIGRTDLAVYAARRAARKGIISVDTGYPTPKLPVLKNIELALVLSVVRQESNFDPRAKSRSGALGYMQILPRTGQAVAKKLNIKFKKSQLTRDIGYNVKIGSVYLAKLIEKYKGNYVLALAAYNAGPHNVKKWLKKRGTPSDVHVDITDWIERIPYAETRNYVQRVVENLAVYRSLLNTADNQTRNPLMLQPLLGRGINIQVQQSPSP